MHNNKPRIKKIKTIPIAINQFVKFQKDLIEMPDGTQTEYFLANRGGRASFVLPVADDGRLLVLHEYRYPVDDVIIGPIGGAVEKGETPLDAAKRELREEAGYQAATWHLLGEFYAAPAKSDSLFFGYIATNLRQVPAQPDQLEYVTPAWYTLPQLESEIRAGAIRDPYLLDVLYLYSIHSRS